MPVVVTLYVLVGFSAVEQLIEVTLALSAHGWSNLNASLDFVGSRSYLDAVVVVWREVRLLKIHIAKIRFSTGSLFQSRDSFVKPFHNSAVFESLFHHHVTFTAKVNTIVPTFVNKI